MVVESMGGNNWSYLLDPGVLLLMINYFVGWCVPSSDVLAWLSGLPFTLASCCVVCCAGASTSSSHFTVSLVFGLSCSVGAEICVLHDGDDPLTPMCLSRRR